MTSPPTHLIILQHGLVSTPSAWAALQSVLRDSKGDAMLVHCAASNSGWFRSFFATIDGVDVGGRRLADEIKQLVAANSSLKYLSIVGSSLGGLYARYAIGLLFDAQTKKIAGLTPLHYVSLATPHVGVQHSLSLILQWFVWFGLLGRTGFQLLCFDNGELMRELTSERFVAALAAFRFRHAYSNLVNDTRVDYQSAALRLQPIVRDDGGGKRTSSSSGEIVAVCQRAVTFDDDAKSLSRVRLTPQQLGWMRTLRQLSWRTVDLNFVNFLSLFLAHSCMVIHPRINYLLTFANFAAINGRYSKLPFSNGAESMRDLTLVLQQIDEDDDDEQLQ